MQLGDVARLETETETTEQVCNKRWIRSFALVRPSKNVSQSLILNTVALMLTAQVVKKMNWSHQRQT